MNDMWYMGMYVASALDATVCNSMPFMKRRKKGKYLEEPIRVIPLTEEEKREKEEKALEQFVNFFNAFEDEAKGKDKEDGDVIVVHR